jgi:hypothetical protein
MSDHGVLPSDMDPPDALRCTPPGVDFGTIDRLLAGRLEEADAPPGYEGVAELVAAATPPVDPDELAGEQAAIDRFVAIARAHSPTPTPRGAGTPGRPVGVKAAALIVVAVLSIGGAAAAATGRLHRPPPSGAGRTASATTDGRAARPPTAPPSTAAAPAITASPPRRTTPPPRPGLAVALAHFGEVLTTAQRQGTVDPAAADLLHLARDVGRAVQAGNGEDAHKQLADLERKVDELIQQGKIRSVAAGPVREAVAQFRAAVHRFRLSAQATGSRGSGQPDAAAGGPEDPPAPGRGDPPDDRGSGQDR